MDGSWMKEFPGAMTICDRKGIIVSMNDKAAIAFQSDGGKDLIGKNLLDCHPEPARSKLGHLMESGETNVYSIEKKGVKKLIYQAPWYRDGIRMGIVELSLEIPFEIPHFLRA